jgi:hypothetical protein
VIAPGLAQTQEIDTNLKWETNEQTNVGVDFGFFNNSVTFSVDYFVRDAKNLLLYRSIRPSTGYSSIYTNAGQIRNSGFEFLGVYQNRSGDWFYNIKLNASTLKNKVIDVGEPIVSSAGPATNDNWNEWLLTQNGHPIASFYAWRVDGVFQTQEEIDALNAKVPAGVNSGYYQTASTRPGDYKYRDLTTSSRAMNGYPTRICLSTVGSGRTASSTVPTVSSTTSNARITVSLKTARRRNASPKPKPVPYAPTSTLSVRKRTTLQYWNGRRFQVGTRDSPLESSMIPEQYF